AGALISFTQLYADEYQNAFNKSGLSRRANIPNCLFRVFLSACVVGLSVAARLYSPEIDPGYCARIVFFEGECTKGGEVLSHPLIF
ncbi:MAG: hypothetical protein J2P56_10185, partial [Verrucomicrobia bacterium]|nr:hypothetical protein [Verrucomicrobiota bacterium]